MPIIANTSLANTFSAVLAQLNLVTKRINQFAINESTIYANTITSNVSFRVSGTLLANNTAGTSGYYLRTSGTGIYWSPVAAQTQYLQVANAVATYQTKAVERAALANTNSYISTQASRITLVNTNLLGTNTAIRALDTQKLSVANATTLLAAKATWSGLTSTNTALRTLISDRLQVANASTLYATKSNPITSGLLAHTGRATISTNLAVSGNTIISGTLVANSSAGVAGYYLRSSGTGIYWSPVSGGGANGFSGILVGANVISADSATDRLTFVAGSGITLAANPTTDTITISSTASGAAANVVTKAVKDLTQNDTVVTSVSGVVVGGSAVGAVGGGTDKVFYENDITITANYTIGTNKNAMTAGPVTINADITVTVPSGSVWSII